MHIYHFLNVLLGPSINIYCSKDENNSLFSLLFWLFSFNTFQYNGQYAKFSNIGNVYKLKYNYERGGGPKFQGK